MLIGLVIIVAMGIVALCGGAGLPVTMLMMAFHLLALWFADRVVDID